MPRSNRDVCYSPESENCLRVYESTLARLSNRVRGRVNEDPKAIRLTDVQHLDWRRLIRSQNVGPRGIMAQTPQGG
jgi:hypothetical protein